MKKYVTRFIVSLLICLIFINSFINKEYKLLAEENSVEIEMLEQFIKEFSVVPQEIKEQMNDKEEVVEEEIIEVSNKQELKINSVFEKEEFTITSYDLSVQSCGKKVSSRGYGITRSGFDLRGHNWKTARVIATDPKIIPLGSIVYIQFINEDYFKYNGVYVSEDTGSAIKGYRIDLFFEDTGEEVSSEAMNFGVTKARIIILNKDGGI
jgi:3D (Asp-Asp-Asp) domain-containing protein